MSSASAGTAVAMRSTLGVSTVMTMPTKPTQNQSASSTARGSRQRSEAAPSPSSPSSASTGVSTGWCIGQKPLPSGKWLKTPSVRQSCSSRKRAVLHSGL